MTFDQAQSLVGALGFISFCVGLLTAVVLFILLTGKDGGEK